MPRSQALSFAIKRRSSPLHRTNHGMPSFYQPYLSPSHCQHRQFTQRPFLRLVSRPSTRPQLPFLYTPSKPLLPSSSSTSQPLISRYTSNSARSRWRETLRYQLKLHAYFWPALFLVGTVIAGLHQTWIEHRYPTPREWGFWTRWYLRTALFTERDEGGKIDRVLTDWGKAGRMYKGCVTNLEEDAGVNTERSKEEEILVEGLGRVAVDVRFKTEAWRRGYHEALMGCARAAENLEGMAKWKGEHFYEKLVPWDSVVGPRNVRPRPLPWDREGLHKNPPREEDMEDAFPSPEYYYMKVLTTVGFNSRQKLDAAVAYADWCDFKGLTDTAGSMYDWALDIATSALPEDKRDVINANTGVIRQGRDQFVTDNLLRATTALGVHYARIGDVKSALPVFLSILRARRSLPPMPVEYQEVVSRPRDDDDSILSYFTALKDLIIERPYPAAPSNGDVRPFHTLKEACEEVGIMTYIGEILFATSEKEREKGLSWTRDSVGAAEAVLWVMDERGEQDSEGRERCRECLETGLNNWQQMARQMVSAAKNKEKKTVPETETGKSWLGLGSGKGSSSDEAKDELSRWTEEEAQIELRKLKTASLVHPLKPTGSSWATA